MSLTLTQLASDNFQRANVNPLTAPWALDLAGDNGLKILSDQCYPAAENNQCVMIYDLPGGTPANQYASTTFETLGGNGQPVYLGIRITDGGGHFTSGWAGYVLAVNPLPYESPTGTWTLYNWLTNTVLASGTMTANVGDVFTLAAVGTQLYILQNGTQLGSVSDSSFAAGSTALGFPSFSGDPSLSNFAVGQAAVSTGGSGDGTVVTITGKCDYPLGATVTLSTQVANRLIAAGLATQIGQAAGDGTVVTITANCDYPLGATITLSVQVATRLIAAGLAVAV